VITDVLIIGGGGAGARCAIECSDKRVVIAHLAPAPPPPIIRTSVITVSPGTYTEYVGRYLGIFGE